MASSLLFSFVIGYFLLLLLVAWRTSRHANNESFFIGNRNSNWMLVAFGMIGTSLSGVTFVSVPGTVGAFGDDGFAAFGYFQVIIGNWIGYLVVALVLLPLYYRLNLTSIYRYLRDRFGVVAYRTGALFFILSRTVGATARLYLVINILHLFILKEMGISFGLTTGVILLMILLYTFEGGVKTIVYTDTLQTTFMLLGLVVCTVYILQHLGLSVGDAMNMLEAKGLGRIFHTEAHSKNFFVKQILGGVFISIAMTGLDQEMMQKNISVRNVRDSKKNMVVFCFVFALVSFLFLLLGGLLYVYAQGQGAVVNAGHQLILGGKNVIGDGLFPTLALHYLPKAVSIIFIIALISALFPSADGALTALTSSFCIDLLDLRGREGMSEGRKRRFRLVVHVSFTIIFLVCILIFKQVNNPSTIRVILDLAGYTYGPLLGLFSFGIFTRRSIPDNWTVTAWCILAPVVCWFVSQHAVVWFGGYQIGIELLLINGMLTFAGLAVLSRKSGNAEAALGEGV